MRRIAFLLVLVSLSLPAEAQWKKIVDFQGQNQGYTFGETVSCVYFLDLPGPPRIGFCGTESELWKTIDGGKNWTHSWGDGDTYAGFSVSGICFRDSLNGWFSMDGGVTLFRTSNGGDNWTELTVPDSSYGALDMHYCKGSNRLFLAMSWDYTFLVSTDLGDTWDTVPNYLTGGGFSFWSDSVGITTAEYIHGDTIGVYLLTSDGGMTWDTLPYNGVGGGFMLCLAGTSTCFSATAAQIIISRSDDYGQTWRVLKDFGPYQDSNFNFIAPYGTGDIAGDLSRLYIQSDSGMFVSTDEGITWKNDGGPKFFGDCNQVFYAAKGVAIAGSTTLTSASSNGILNGGGLWEETWPTSGVAERTYTASSFRIFPNPATDALQILGGQSGTVHLFDLMGRERMNIPVDGTRTTLDVSKLTNGTYFVRSGNQSTKVVIAR